MINDDIFNYKITITPQEGMYEGGKFVFSAEYPPNYPNNPPKVKCLTQVYHPNIDLEGHVCLSILRVGNSPDNWDPTRTFGDLTNGLFLLFIDPNPNDPLNIEAGDMMRGNREEFEKLVRKTLKGGKFFGKYFEPLI